MKKRPLADYAEQILLSEGTPLHYREVTNRIMNKIQLRGKTPQNSVRAAMGNNPKFIRIAEGIYALSEWEDYSAARFAKDIAYDILTKRGKPMSLIDLGNAILLERDFKNHPSNVGHDAIRNDSRFIYDRDNKSVGLVKWK